MNEPKNIEVRGARVHNLKNVDVNIPLHEIVGIAGVSGSGKSSLALGVLYAEGLRRYLESLSTYTRRRMTQASRADVDEVLYVPASLALHQRPGVPGIRSTFGTGTELLNSLRLMYSRLSSHRCPNGHYVKPGFQVALMQEIVCPECGKRFYGPGAEELAFNSQGACKCCGGTGTVRTVDRSTLVPDESISIDDGAVAPWNSLMWSLMTDVCRAMGVRTDIPFKDLTEREKEIVFDGPMEKKHIFYRPKKADTATAGEMDFTYYSATATVMNALSKVKDEKGMKRVEKFLKEDVCPECHGTRLSEEARAPKLMGISLDQACEMTLKKSVEWVRRVPDSLPEEMRPMAHNICESYLETAARLLDLGLGYLSLDRASSTLSTGERQRMQLARAVRNRTTGVLYVLDEPSIGLHPANIVGLNGVMHDLVRDGNSVLLVDHDTQILKESDWIIEMGPEAGRNGGTVIAEGTVEQIEENEVSVIGRYLSGKQAPARKRTGKELFASGEIRMDTDRMGCSDITQLSQFESACKKIAEKLCVYGFSQLAEELLQRIEYVKNHIVTEQKYQNVLVDYERYEKAKLPLNARREECNQAIQTAKEWISFWENASDYDSKKREKIIIALTEKVEQISELINNKEKDMLASLEAIPKVFEESTMYQALRKLEQDLSFGFDNSVIDKANYYLDKEAAYTTFWERAAKSFSDFIQCSSSFEEEEWYVLPFSNFADDRRQYIEQQYQEKAIQWMQKHPLPSEQELEEYSEKETEQLVSSLKTLPDYLSGKDIKRVNDFLEYIYARNEKGKVLSIERTFVELSKQNQQECIARLTALFNADDVSEQRKEDSSEMEQDYNKPKMKNVEFTEDEMILLLHVYMLHRDEWFTAQKDYVIELSNLYRTLPIHSDELRKADNFRNPAGIDLQLRSLAKCDPSDYHRQKLVASAAMRKVWSEYANNRPELHDKVIEIVEKYGIDTSRYPTLF